jgi:hypothetical protein
MPWQDLMRAILAMLLLGAAVAVADEPAVEEAAPLPEAAAEEAAPLPEAAAEEAMPLAEAAAPGWSASADPEGYPPAPHPFPSHAYNYYYPTPGNDMMPARMYLCPRPIPLYVGYTYITYQGLAPHEFLYQHQRTYYRYHPGSGTTVTWITWR